MPEKVSLKLNDFQNKITTSFGNLRYNSDLSDVTLVCEGGQQMEAHRVFLAASSLFFENLFKNNKDTHYTEPRRG